MSGGGRIWAHIFLFAHLYYTASLRRNVEEPPAQWGGGGGSVKVRPNTEPLRGHGKMCIGVTGVLHFEMIFETGRTLFSFP